MRRHLNVLIVGFGDIGRRVAMQLAPRCQVSALVRSPAAAKAAQKLGVLPLRGDLGKPRSLSHLRCRFDVIFHFAPPPNAGVRDTYTRNLINALFPTTTLAKMLPRRSSPRFVYISTTGVYGDCRGEWIDETRALRPRTARARRRVDAERALTDAARRKKLTLRILRAPGIYDAVRLPITRLQRGLPALHTEDDVWSNHIHADDLATACIAALRGVRDARVFNVVDDAPLLIGDYFALVARAAGLPPPPRLPAAQMREKLTPMQFSFMEESRRIRNGRLKRELGISLRYPTVEAFLAQHSIEGASGVSTKLPVNHAILPR